MDFINKGVYMQLFVLIQFLLKETYLVEIYHLAEIISNILFWWKLFLNYLFLLILSKPDLLFIYFKPALQSEDEYSAGSFRSREEIVSFIISLTLVYMRNYYI